jgi:2',3'-cyclic-nucleotide 2'-phosphodiesterase (5'-nucleotidase family)
MWRDEKSKVILPGDLLGASMYATAHRGQSVLDLLNHIPIDYCTLGNHEFDFGGERTSELMKMSKFPWLGSNVRNSSNPSTQLFSNVMDFDEFEINTVKAGRIKVGVFGRRPRRLFLFLENRWFLKTSLSMQKDVSAR